MKTIAILLVTCTIFLSIGCSKRDNELSASDLSKAIGISWWVIDIPESRDGEYLGVSFQDSNQKNPDHGGAGGWPAGSAKIFIYDEDQERISYAIIGANNLLLRGSRPNGFIGYAGASIRAPIGSRVKLGDILIKKSKENFTDANPNELSSEEVGIAVTISKPDN